MTPRLPWLPPRPKRPVQAPPVHATYVRARGMHAAARIARGEAR